MKQEYRILSSSDHDYLQKEVNALLHFGWELHGFLQSVPMENVFKGYPNYVQYTQAMVKEDCR